MSLPAPQRASASLDRSRRRGARVAGLDSALVREAVAGRAAGRASVGSWMSAADSDRDARADRDEPSRTSGSSRELRRRARLRLERPRRRRRARPADRPSARAPERRRARRGRHPGTSCRQCRSGRQWRRILGAMPRLRVAPPSSTSSSATSTATRRGSSRPTSGRGRRARPGGLPRAGDHRLPARGPAAAARVRGPGGRGAREARGPHRAVRRGRRLPRGRPRPRQRAAVCATARCTASTASTSCPNYAVFDEQRYFAAVDGPTARCSSSPACGSA